MELNFTRLGNPDEYSIALDGETLFIAAYNKKENTRELYSLDEVKLAQAFYADSKSFQLVPDYSIQLFTKDKCEVLVKSQSIVRQNYFFDFRGYQHFVLSQIGCKYSIFRDGRRVAVYRGRDVNNGHQNRLQLTDNGLCTELFCLLALYLHSDLDLILPQQTRSLI